MRLPRARSSTISMRRELRSRRSADRPGGAEEVEGTHADGVAEGFWVVDAPGTYGPEPHDLKVAEEHAFAGRI